MKQFLKIVANATLILLFAITQSSLFSTYEAHIVNLTAQICNYSKIQIHPMDYWKDHPNIYARYLPLGLGDKMIYTVADANDVFQSADSNETKNMLRAQLLAAKFNIAYFSIGEYFVESESKTLDEVVAETDDLLKQDPEPPKEELEKAKDLLNFLNNLGEIRYCTEPPPQIDQHLVINEVYYDVKCHGWEGWNEWLEIYNPLDVSVDISGWKIGDNSASEDIIPSSDSIPAGGFAIVTPWADTWNYWPSIPSEAIKIVLKSKIGNGLSNSGDRVILKDNSGKEIDAVSYGTDTYAFDPSVPDVREGHSIARYPKGYDTNQASDWIDLSWPNPGTNPYAEERVSIIAEGEIGCAEGQTYVLEERDISEDPEEMVGGVSTQEGASQPTQQVIGRESNPPQPVNNEPPITNQELGSGENVTTQENGIELIPTEESQAITNTGTANSQENSSTEGQTIPVGEEEQPTPAIEEQPVSLPDDDSNNNNNDGNNNNNDADDNANNGNNYSTDSNSQNTNQENNNNPDSTGVENGLL